MNLPAGQTSKPHEDGSYLELAELTTEAAREVDGEGDAVRQVAAAVGRPRDNSSKATG